MTLPVHLTREAEEDLAHAQDYYERQQVGLGAELVDELERCIQRIAQFPESGSPAFGGLRRGRLSRFPYAIVYRVLPTSVRVLAVANLFREPRSWTDRG